MRLRADLGAALAATLLTLAAPLLSAAPPVSADMPAAAAPVSAAPMPAPAVTAMTLKPFRATYSAAMNGMPLGFPVVVELVRGSAPTGARASDDDAESWALALTAKSTMIDYREQSSFRWHNCTSTPVRYRFDVKGLGINRKLWLDFDHATHKASGQSRKGPLSYVFPADATDELSLGFATRCLLARGATEVHFNAATINGMKKLSYRNSGKEKIKTPLGTFDTLRIDRIRKANDKRRSTVWVAPALDYLMIKMEHVENVGVRGTVLLKKLEMAEKTSTATATMAPATMAPVPAPPAP